MARITRLFILGAAGAGAAYFLRQRAQGGGGLAEATPFGGAQESAGDGGPSSASGSPPAEAATETGVDVTPQMAESGGAASEEAAREGADVPIEPEGEGEAGTGDAPSASAGSVQVGSSGPVGGSGGAGGAAQHGADQPSLSGGATHVGEAVVPDTGSDPLVREQENAAAAEAASIGGSGTTPVSADDPGLAADEAMKPVVEGSGAEHETLESTDRDLGAGRERLGSPSSETPPDDTP